MPVCIAGLVTFAAASASIMGGLRPVLYPLIGLRRFDHGVMPLRNFIEAPRQTIGFVAMVGSTHAFDAFRAAREREVRAARLQTVGPTRAGGRGRPTRRRRR